MPWIAIVIGLVAGVFSGLFGIGGGVVVVPLLVLIGLSLREAVATSLAALMLPVGLLGVLTYWREGFVRLPVAVLLAIGLAVGVYLGSHLNRHLPEDILRRGFAVLLLVLAVQLFLKH